MPPPVRNSVRVRRTIATPAWRWFASTAATVRSTRARAIVTIPVTRKFGIGVSAGSQPCHAIAG